MPMCVLIFLDFQLKPFLFPKEFKSAIATLFNALFALVFTILIFQ
jgi:hypothetical protein